MSTDSKVQNTKKGIVEALNKEIKALLERKDALLRFLKSEELRVNEVLRRIKDKDAKGEKVTSDEIQEHLFGFMQYQVYEKELVATFERLNALVSFAKDNNITVSYRKSEVEEVYLAGKANQIFTLKDGEIQYADEETPELLRQKIKGDYNDEIEQDFLAGLRKHTIPTQEELESEAFVSCDEKIWEESVDNVEVVKE